MAKLSLVSEKDIDAELERERLEEISAFNSAGADYLEALAKVCRPSKGERELSRLDDKLSEARSSVMALPAVSKYQIRYKFEVLRRQLTEYHSHDDDLREIVDSIERDIEWRD